MKIYGSLRKYRQYLRKRGDYRNPSEQKFKEEVGKMGIKVLRRGYPDFIIIKKGRVIGFVEIKPSKESTLKGAQKIFKGFCEENKINFAQWSPEEPLPQFIQR